jgi:hypothetical protein
VKAVCDFSEEAYAQAHHAKRRFLRFRAYAQRAILPEKLKDSRASLWPVAQRRRCAADTASREILTIGREVHTSDEVHLHIEHAAKSGA